MGGKAVTKDMRRVYAGKCSPLCESCIAPRLDRAPPGSQSTGPLCQTCGHIACPMPTQEELGDARKVHA